MASSKSKAKRALMLPNNMSVLDRFSFDREESYQQCFMEQYVTKSPYHYVRKTKILKAIDDYCDPRVMVQGDTCKPLVVVGSEGSGKSATLANFVKRRVEQNYNESGKKRTELVFYHHAGSSKASLEVKNFLYRACRAIRDFFELNRQLKYDETFLSWEFPRALELAAQKGRVIIVIDGIEHLHLTEQENNLRWFPINFPGNTRVILSYTSTAEIVSSEAGRNLSIVSSSFITQSYPVSTNASSAGDAHEETDETRKHHSRVKVELFRRRLLPIIEVSLMDRNEILEFIEKYTAEDLKSKEKDAHYRRLRANISFGGGKKVDKGMIRPNENFSQIRKSQKVKATPIPAVLINRIVNHKASENPQYLQTLMGAIRFFASRSVDLWHLLAKSGPLLSTSTTPELLCAIIRFAEKGYKPDDLTKDDAVEKAWRSGGKQGLTNIDKIYKAIQGSNDKNKNGGESDDYGDSDFDDSPRGGKSGGNEEDSYMSKDSLPSREEVEKDTKGMPNYLLGGRTFEGFRGIVSHAIALLGASYYGLEANDLWQLLKQMEVPCKSIRRDDLVWLLHYLGVNQVENLLTVPPRGRASLLANAIDMVSSKKKADEDDEDSLPIVQRNVVMQYIRAYFTRLPLGQRRVEELPQHLAESCKWNALKNSIVQVPMFIFMYKGSPHLRHKLTQYWKQLANNIFCKDDYQPSPTSKTSFDPVHEYNRSVQDWCSIVHPSSVELTHVLLQILNFFKEFSRFESKVPKFKHPGLDFHQLKKLGLPKMSVHNRKGSLRNHPHYFYKRWIWVQFPWMALGQPRAAEIKNDERLEELQLGKSGDKRPSTGGSGFWSVKKIDPQKGPKVKASYHRMNARMNLKIQKENPSENVNTAEPATMSVEMARKRSLEARNRSLKKSLGARIPHASPTTRSVKYGTRFPTVEQFAKEKGERIHPIFTGGVVDEKDARSMITATPATTAHLANVPVHMSQYSIDEAQQKQAEAQRHMNILREQFDKLVFEDTSKQAILDKLLQSVAERERQDAFTIECIKDGEMMMDELSSRLDRMNDALSDARNTEEFYKKVINFCDKTPFRERHQLSTLEDEATRIRERFYTLLRQQQEAELERKNLLKYAKPQFLKEMKNNEELRHGVLEKLSKMQTRLERSQEEKQSRMKRRQEIVLEVAGDLTSAEEKKLLKNVQKQKVVGATLKVSEEQYKSKLAEYEAAFERIKNATGISEPNEIFAKFMNRTNEEASLIEQKEAYEEMGRDLAFESSRLQKELDSLKYGSTVISSRKIRQIDDTNFQAESELKIKQAKFKEAHTLFKDVRDGVIHLSKMLGVKAKSLNFKKEKAEGKGFSAVIKDIETKLGELYLSSLKSRGGSGGGSGGGGLKSFGSIRDKKMAKSADGRGTTVNAGNDGSNNGSRNKKTKGKKKQFRKTAVIDKSESESSAEEAEKNALAASRFSLKAKARKKIHAHLHSEKKGDSPTKKKGAAKRRSRTRTNKVRR
eukprot:g1558.t1